MQRGIWHQMGDRSQKIVLEELELGVGVGVIISPRDLAIHKAEEYREEYSEYGVSILIDHQFYNPKFENAKINSYELYELKKKIDQQTQLSPINEQQLASTLEHIHKKIKTDAIIAPSLKYESGRTDIVQLNSKLFRVAKSVGDVIGIPTYASVILGNSIIGSEENISNTLSHATSLDSDGWYYGFEFKEVRIPSNKYNIYNCLRSGLTLAATGLPVLHCFAGPMSLLSLGFGATGTTIGHFQNLWQFDETRWENSIGDGGDASAPPRFFSKKLWGTIVQPDELVTVGEKRPDLVREILTHSPFSSTLYPNYRLPWIPKWESNKHLIYIIGKTINDIADNSDPRVCAEDALNILNYAIKLHDEIKNQKIELKDKTNSYQIVWRNSLLNLLHDAEGEYDYLQLLSH